jgi:hypothetical protein
VPPVPADARSSIAEHLAHVASSYPHNHDYRVVRGELRPKFKLWMRWRKIRKLYPERLVSMMDLSSSKGFFVLEAARVEGCERALGIDVHEPDLVAARAVAEHVGRSKARFVRSRLHEVAERIEDFGGPFQTVLLLNTYPYLYYGSRRDARAYLDHERVFEWLAQVTAERVIFSNRVAFERLPRHMQELARAQGGEAGYDEGAIVRAAERWFEVERRGRLGRIPLWVLWKRA